jgi:excisionase family DNA binding protein
MTRTCEPGSLTPEEVADRCSVGVGTVMAWIASGQLKARRASGGASRARVDPEEFHAFLERGRGETTQICAVKPLPSVLVTYFLHNPVANQVKIGRTKELKRRHQGLRTAGGVELRLIGYLEGDHEKHYHARFAAHRRIGEWFAITPELALWVRDQFGYRLQAPRGLRLRAPALGIHDIAHDLEALAGSALRSPNPEHLTDYLEDAFWPGSPLNPTDADDQPDAGLSAEALAEIGQGDLDTAIAGLCGFLEPWEAHWIGWMAPATPREPYLDLWLAYWCPAGVEAARQLRTALARAAIVSDYIAIEPLRLRPVLVDRETAALEPLPPEELYSDELQFPLMQGACWP